MRRLLLRVRVASLTLRLADSARLKKVGTGPEVLGSTMPWGLNPPRGHPILALRLDGAVLAMVVREASGRRGGSRKKAAEGRGKGAAAGRHHRRGRASRNSSGLFAGASGDGLGSRARGAGAEHREPATASSSSSSARRFERKGAATRSTSFSSRGGLGSMTEGAITVTVASVRAEGSDAGVDKSRGVMLPILAVFPRRKLHEAEDHHVGNDTGGVSSADNNPANNTTTEDSFIADIGAASSSVAGGSVIPPGEGDDAFVSPPFLSPPPPPPPPQPPAERSFSGRCPSSSVPTSPGGAGLEVSVRWTLEPLHGRGGGGISMEPGGPRHRRSSTTSTSGTL